MRASSHETALVPDNPFPPLTQAVINTAMSTHIKKYGSAAPQYYELFCFCEPEDLIYVLLAVPEGTLHWLTQISPNTKCL